MTDRTETIAALSRGDWQRAQELLDKAQNRPPHGAADGSINARQWEALRGIILARKQYMRERGIFLRRWKLARWPSY